MSDTETTDTPSTTLYVSPIADPLMGGKLQARTMKLVKKAATSKCLRRGVPEVLKAIRKGQKGIVLLAADVYPVDVIAHVPAYCEKNGIPYAYVPSRQALGSACQTKRAASVVLVTEPKDDSTYTKTYEQVHKGVVSINPYLVSLMRHYSRSDFEFGSLLGAGAFAQVVHVRDKLTGEEFALKILDKKTIQRLGKTPQVLNERDTLTKLRDCDNIVKLYFTFQDHTWLYFGLEYCEGGDLAEEIGRWGRVPEDLAKFYAAEIVNMLVQLRSKGLAHRDLKPDNILISKGHLKLVDFDAAKSISPNLAYQCERSASHEGRPTGDQLPKPCQSASSSSDISSEIAGGGDDGKADRGDDSQFRRMNTFVGTAQYVSPEMLSDSAVAGFASDLWALGCIIYQMIVGYSPFQSGSEYQTFQMILATQYDMPDDVSDVAKDLINKLLVSDPGERLGFRNLGELKAHPFFDGIDFATLPFTPPPPESHHYRYHHEETEGQPGDDLSAEFGVPSTRNGGMEISIDEDDWSYDSDDDDDRTPMVGQVFGGHAQRIIPFNFVEAANASVVKSPTGYPNRGNSNNRKTGKLDIRENNNDRATSTTTTPKQQQQQQRGDDD